MTGELAGVVQRLKSGRCVLCAGSRLGSDWHFTRVIQRLFSSLTESDALGGRALAEAQPLLAAGHVRRRMGERLPLVLQDLFAVPSNGATDETVALLAALPFRAVVTTSWSDAFERAWSRPGDPPTPLVTPHDAHEAGVLVGHERLVFKALGEAARGDTLLFCAADVQAALAHGGFRLLTDELFPQRSFLFVGFEPEDPDFKLLLERVLAGARTGDVEHYAVLPGLSVIAREELLHAYGVRVLAESDVAALAKSLGDALAQAPAGSSMPDEDDLEGWLAVLRADPERPDALAHLDRLEASLRRRGNLDRLVEYYLARAAVEIEPRTRRALLERLARLFELDHEDGARAFTTLLAAYHAAPSREAWRDLERLAHATGRYDELTAEIEESLPILPEGDRAEAQIFIDEARIHSLRRDGRWDELTTVLSRRAAEETDLGRRAERYLELAELHEERLGQTAQAMSCFKRALEADPSSNDARLGLEALHRRRGENTELVALLEASADRASEDERRTILREIAQLYADSLGDRRAAIQRYEDLRRDEPGDLAVLRALEKLYDEEGMIREHLEVLQAQVGLVEDVRERAGMYRRLAEGYEERLGSSAQAEECLEWLLTYDGGAEDAYRGLERLYCADGRWRAAIDVYLRHAQIATGAARAEVYLQIAAIYERHIRDLLRAVDFHLKAEPLLADPDPSLEALARLYERLEHFDRAVETLLRRAERREAPADKVELIHHAALLTAIELSDASGAESLFLIALDVSPTHVPTMLALVEIYRQRRDLTRASKLLAEAVAATTSRLERPGLLLDLGMLLEEMDQRDEAAVRYKEILAADAEHIEAATRLAKIFVDTGRHEEAIPLLEMLARKPAPADLQLERFLRLARSATAAGSEAKSLRAWSRAVEVAPTALPARRGHAEALLAAGQWAQAHKGLVGVLAQHEAVLDVADRCDIFAQLATCAIELDRRSEAKTRIEAALALDPKHRPSLRTRLLLEGHDPTALIAAKRAFLTDASPEEQIQLHLEIGEVYLTRLDDPLKAMGAYRDALELKPTDHKLLHRCLDLYVEQKKWTEATRILERLVQHEKVPSVRARYRHAAGAIYRDELNLEEEAVGVFAASLEDDPTLERAAEALEELLAKLKRWPELAQYYAQAVQRIGPEAPDGRNEERLRLWSALGEVLLTRLGQRADAMAALEVATHFEPDNLERQQHLADLYVQGGPEFSKQAIARHQQLLRLDPKRVPSYRALETLYTESGHFGEAQICAEATAYVQDGTLTALSARGLEALRERLEGNERGPALEAKDWRLLAHADEDRLLSALFSTVEPLLAAAHASPHRQAGLARKDLVEADDARPIGRALRHVAHAYGLPLPEAYVRPEQEDAITFVTCVVKQKLVPVLLLGKPLLAKDRPLPSLLFDVARPLSHLRPGRYVRYLLPNAAQLAHIIDASMALAAEAEPAVAHAAVGAASRSGGRAARSQAAASSTPPSAAVASTLQTLRRGLSPMAYDQVVQVGSRLRSQGTRSEAAALSWLRAGDLTASRAGLVLTGDLGTAIRRLETDPPSPFAYPTLQRIAELVSSSVSDELLAVRRLLGTMPA